MLRVFPDQPAAGICSADPAWDAYTGYGMVLLSKHLASGNIFNIAGRLHRLLLQEAKYTWRCNPWAREHNSGNPWRLLCRTSNPEFPASPFKQHRLLRFNLFNEFSNPAGEKDPTDIHCDPGGIHGDHYRSLQNKRANAHLNTLLLTLCSYAYHIYRT